MVGNALIENTMLRDKVILFDSLWHLSVNRPAIKYWIKQKPHCIMQIIQTADKNLKRVVAMQPFKKKSFEYLLALSSIGSLANILSTKCGLKFIMEALPLFDFLDLLVCSILYLENMDCEELKWEILRCIRFGMRYTIATEHLRKNEILYHALKLCLTTKATDDVIENTLSIIEQLFFYETEPEVSYYVVKRLPSQELQRIACTNRKRIKQKTLSILDKASEVYRTHQEICASMEYMKEKLQLKGFTTEIINTKNGLCARRKERTKSPNCNLRPKHEELKPLPNMDFQIEYPQISNPPVNTESFHFVPNIIPEVKRKVRHYKKAKRKHMKASRKTAFENKGNAVEIKTDKKIKFRGHKIYLHKKKRRSHKNRSA